MRQTISPFWATLTLMGAACFLCSCGQTGAVNSPGDSSSAIVCTSNTDCADVCIDNLCTARASAGGTCDELEDCVAGYDCSLSTCVGATGTTCMTNDDCAEVCLADTCGPPSALGAVCDETEDCEGSTQCTGDLCRNVAGVACTTNVDCVDACVNSTCAPFGIEADACNQSDDCVLGLECWRSECTTELWYSLGESAVGTWFEHIGGADWGGGVSASGGNSAEVSMAVDSTGMPMIAWTRSHLEHSDIYVRRYDGTRWTSVGAGSASGLGVSNTLGTSRTPCLVLDGNDQPWIAWQERLLETPLGEARITWQIHVKRFDGAAWVEVGAGSASGGGVSASETFSGDSSIVIDAQGLPVIFWTEHVTVDAQIHAKRFDGSRWVDIGSASSTGAGVSVGSGVAWAPKAVVTPAGIIVVAWNGEILPLRQVYARQFDGSNWRSIGTTSSLRGGISNTPGWSREVSLALTAQGQPVAVWNEVAGDGHNIHVRKFDGTSWVEWGPNSATGGGVSNTTGKSSWPSIFVDSQDRAVVAWTEPSSEVFSQLTEIHIRRFQDGFWRQMGATSAYAGGVSNYAGISWLPVVAIGAQDVPYVAWTETPDQRGEIFVRRFDGTAWEGVGQSTGAGHGISHGTSAPKLPSLVVNGAGGPAVVWVGETPAGSQIYGSFYDGQNWVAMSDIDAGESISAGSGTSAFPELAVDSQGRYVAVWADDRSGNYEIYVLRYAAGQWREVGTGSASGGGISNNSATSWDATLVVDSQDRPIVAWEDWSGGQSDIYVRRFDGSTWQEMGVGTATAQGISDTLASSQLPHLAIDAADVPTVLWLERVSGNVQVYVRAYDGTNWVEVGVGSATGQGLSQGTVVWDVVDLVVDGSDRPIATWTDGLNLHVSRFDPLLGQGQWAPVGDAMPSDLDLGEQPDFVWAPALGLGAGDHPVVAWTVGMGGTTEVLAAQFDGTAWEFIGNPNAGLLSVSNSAGYSGHVSIAIEAGRCCAAWVEAATDSREIVLRCTDLE